RREKELVEQTVFQVGIETITVPSIEKNAVDNLIIKHCKKHIISDRRIRNVILITGDKDYLTLVEDLKKLGIKVILIYGSNISQGLKKAVNEVYQINQIVSINPNQEESKKLEHPALVTYEEAKKYLIELIKMVQAKGQKATLALMGS
ncbi:NYN domain-containing protein, partial [Planktothrix sp.]|uniref:NYN domain-containing protein n=1 Tax=Planktothrix sp. TaxID=3088171 RepID=UPI0038D40269